jgi:type VII secretion protein EssB
MNEEKTYQYELEYNSQLDYNLLNEQCDSYVFTTYTVEDNKVIISADLSNYYYLKDVNLNEIEKYELCYDIIKLTEPNSLLKTEYNPNNIVLDINNKPYILKRDLKLNIEDNNNELLSLKCLNYAIINGLDKYEMIKDSGFNINVNSEFNKKLKEASNKTSLLSLLSESIASLKTTYLNNKVVVRKKSYKMLKYLSIFLGVLVIVAGATSLYQNFIVIPQLSNNQKASEAFINKDYSLVISIMKNDDIKKLNSNQKYYLSIASIEVMNLNDKQRNNIVAQISNKTNPNILEAWIYLGKGDFEEAINKAKQSNDYDLHFYSLVRYLDALRSGNDVNGLSNSDITKKIDEVEKELKSLQQEGKK